MHARRLRRQWQWPCPTRLRRPCFHKKDPEHMPAIVVERQFDRPLNLEEFLHEDRAFTDSLEGVRTLLRSLSPEGRMGFTICDVRDDAILRRAAEASGKGLRVWVADEYREEGVPGERPVLRKGEATFGLVDRSFGQPKEFSELQAIEDAASSCLVMHRVRYICSYLSRDRQRMACLYAAPDLEAIRHACGQIDLPFNQVSRTLVCD
jgi:hypothetical protein